jgi:hypothetical protein
MLNQNIRTFVFLTACLLGAMLITAFAFHLYVTVG